MFSFQDVDLSHRATDISSVPIPRDLWLVDAMPQLVLVSDPDGDVTFCNRAWRVYTGQTRQQAQGEGWAAMVSPDERETVNAHWGEAVQAGFEFQMEYRLYRAGDEAYRWHQVHAAPVRDDDGNLLFWLGLHTDIHDRKLIEERNRALMHGARCLIWYADIEAPPTESPDLWWTIHHPDPDATQQFLPLDLREGEAYHVALYRNRLEPYRTECDLRGGAAVRAGTGFNQEYPVRASDGSLRWLYEDVQVETVIPGQRWKAVCLCVDITERKEAQAQAQENEARFRATFEQAAVGIALVGIHGEWLQINQKLCDILGYTLEELLLTNYDDFRHPEDVEAAARSVRPLFAGTINTYTVERRYLRRDRSIIWGNLTISLVRDATHRPLHYICVIEDISQRKRQEAEIADLNQHLQRRIDEFEILLEEYRRSELELQSANRRLQRAMQETHHRVRNNLQLIAALTEMAIDDHSEGLPPLETRRLLQQILLLSSVHDILTNATNAVEGHTDSLSAKAVLGRMLTLLKETAPRVNFEYHLAEITLNIHQATSLALITNELVNNAIKHGSNAVQVTLTRSGEEVILTVEDDGPGFLAEFNPRMAANTGLALVENLTRHDLSGKQTFENRAGGGGRVLITFPLQPLS
jgi:PAS domain S-box-containing protein